MRVLPQASIKENYDEIKKAKYIAFLKELGSNINFEDDIWCCDKRVRSFAEPLHSNHIYFTIIPREYKELAKYFAILRLLNGITVNGVKTGLTNLAPFFKFLSVQCNSLPVDKCDIRVASKFKIHLDDAGYAVNTKNSIWFNISTLFRTVNGFDGARFKNTFADNPYAGYRKLDYKYIPADVVERLDTVFKEKQELQRQKTINAVLRAIERLKAEGFDIRIKDLVEYTGLSRSVFGKPHIRKVLMDKGIVASMADAAVDDKLSAKLSKEQKLRLKLKEKDEQIKRISAENIDLKSECELLRGRLFLLMQRNSME